MVRTRKVLARTVVAALALGVVLIPATNAQAAARWSIIPSPNPTRDTAQLSDVSCLSSTDCLAVGFTQSTAYPYTPTAAAAHWDGASWSPVAVPLPGGVTRSMLASVSCAGTRCMAVGWSETTGDSRLLSEKYAHGTFTAQPAAPVPEGNGAFNAVSCAAVSACTAVGSQGESGGSAIAERWDGSAWALQELDESGGFSEDFLAGVSCPSAAYCATAGYAFTSSGVVPTFEQWSGGVWTVQVGPEPAGATDTFLNSVACVSTTSCQLVGYYYGTGSGLVAEWWHGGSLQVEDVAAPDDWSNAELLGVSCITGTSCLAVGTNASGASAISAVLADGTWTATAVPDPGSVSATLTDLTCTATTDCLAVGSENPGVGGRLPLIERWTGSNWQLQAAPKLSPYQPMRLTGVSCLAPDDCAATGAADVPATTAAGLTGNGTQWRLTELLAPAAARSDLAYPAVACSAPLPCVYVGSLVTHRHLQQPAIATSATAVSPALPSGARSGGLKDVSCTNAAASCLTVGSWAGGDGISHPLSYRTSNGTHWSSKPVVDPGGASKLAAVSCVNAQFCLAIGATDSGTGPHPFAESWNGSTWALAATPPAAGTTDVLNSVSCSSSTSCVAVGETDAGNGALLYQWDGTSWQRFDVGLPAGSSRPILLSVECPAATCEAVGSLLTGGGTRPLEVRSSGSSWTGAAAPRPAGAMYATFNGISCTAVSACTAVGFWRAGDAIDTTLVERLG